MVFTEKYTVEAKDAGLNGRLMYHLLCGYMQDSANKYCQQAGISVADLNREDKTWVLLGFSIHFAEELPRIGESVTVKTWPRNNSGIRLYRDYRAFLSSGNLVASANSMWVVLDLIKRKPILLHGLDERVTTIGDEALPGTKPGNADLSRFDGAELFKSSEHTVEFHEIDFNGHFGNTNYIDLFIESVPEKYRDTHQLKELRIDFKKECFLGDRLLVHLWQDGCIFGHKLLHARDGSELCRAETLWVGRDI